MGLQRQERAEFSRLAWAFAISMVLHLLIFGGYETGKKYHWWENAHWPAWLSPIKRLAEALKKKDSLQPAQPLQAQQPPLLFVDVDPANASPEVPKNATHYSSLNSQAANPEIDKESNLPKISGEQKHVPKTEDVPRSKPAPLQPAPAAPAPVTKETQEEAKPKPTQAPGDLAMAKPDPNPSKDPGEAPHVRPRRIAEALARQQQDNRMPGQKMKQDGGVRRNPVQPENLVEAEPQQVLQAGFLFASAGFPRDEPVERRLPADDTINEFLAQPAVGGRRSRARQRTLGLIKANGVDQTGANFPVCGSRTRSWPLATPK